jgi:hypothetical protein
VHKTVREVVTSKDVANHLEVSEPTCVLPEELNPCLLLDPAEHTGETVLPLVGRELRVGIEPCHEVLRAELPIGLYLSELVGQRHERAAREERPGDGIDPRAPVKPGVLNQYALSAAARNCGLRGRQASEEHVESRIIGDPMALKQANPSGKRPDGPDDPVPRAYAVYGGGVSVEEPASVSSLDTEQTNPVHQLASPVLFAALAYSSLTSLGPSPGGLSTLRVFQHVVRD